MRAAAQQFFRPGNSSLVRFVAGYAMSQLGKDLAMKSDDSVVSHAAHLMVGMLTGSLAHVTSNERSE